MLEAQLLIEQEFERKDKLKKNAVSLVVRVLHPDQVAVGVGGCTPTICKGFSQRSSQQWLKREGGFKKADLEAILNRNYPSFSLLSGTSARVELKK